MVEVSQSDWHSFQERGFLRLRKPVDPQEFAHIRSSMDRLLAKYPHGFINNGLYLGREPDVRLAAPKLSDRQPTIIFPNVGFLDPNLLRLLANPWLYSLIERAVGKDFYLSNTWFQSVPPSTRRLGFHRDPRGSVTFALLLNDVGPSMGSTCLVPGTHINAPSPDYCLENADIPAPGEIDLDGEAGDIQFFSAETWHGRSENRSARYNQRLFYNFFSRTSRVTTAWAGLVSPEQIEAVRQTLPAHCRHMLEIDPEFTKRIARVRAGGPIRRWALRKSSSESLVHDYFFARSVYGRVAQHPDHPGYLLPFTTRLVERLPFSHRRYVSHFKLRLIARTIMRRTRERAGKLKDRLLGFFESARAKLRPSTQP